MIIEWTDAAWSDYLYWNKNNLTTKLKINKLVASIEASPFTGIGKPEALKHDFAGHWSRRITREHRLIYRVTKTKVIIIACRYHY